MAFQKMGYRRKRELLEKVGKVAKVVGVVTLVGGTGYLYVKCTKEGLEEKERIKRIPLAVVVVEDGKATVIDAVEYYPEIKAYGNDSATINKGWTITTASNEDIYIVDNKNISLKVIRGENAHEDAVIYAEHIMSENNDVLEMGKSPVRTRNEIK